VEESGTSGSPVRFQSMVSSGTLRAPTEARRHSEAAGLASLLPPLAVQPKRKSSEQLCVGATGIVCTNSDLRTLLSLTSSAQEINTAGEEQKSTASKPDEEESSSQEKRIRMKDSRSSSFDMAILQDAEPGAAEDSSSKGSKVSPTSWFAKRHQPMAKKEEAAAKPEAPKVTFTAPDEPPPPPPPVKGRTKRSLSCVEAAKKLVWDRPSGSVVDAHVLGSAIEDFLRRGGEPSGAAGGAEEAKGGEPKVEEKEGSCEPQTAPAATSTGSSICSTLKDLFVK